VAPSDWAMCHLVIHLYGIVNIHSVHSQLPHHLSSQLPHQHLYFPFILPCQHPYNPVTLPHHHSYSYMSYVLPCVSLPLGHVMYDLPCVICTLPCGNSVLVQLNPKMPKSSNTCHLLVLLRVLLMSCRFRLSYH
jgi:hypothetical protein